MGKANVAATFMEHLCSCEAHGYSQAQRWGDESLGVDYVECEGVTGTFYRGDRDCSSAVIDAWREALRGSAYEGCIDGATYTGDMRGAFCGSGLFEWKPMDFIAQRGDVYLNESSHTAMCTCADPDTLAEFSISENGTIYGTPGDQTGGESSIHAYYDFPWDGILHYNGQADGEDASGTSDGGSEPQGDADLPIPRYRAYIRERGWLDWMEGMADTGGSGDDFAGVEGCWVYDLQLENLGPGGWYRIVRADGSETMNESGNTDSPVVGVVVYYDTPNPGSTGYHKAKYRVHWQGSEPGWGKWEYDDEDGGAGKDAGSPLDMFQLTIERA